MKKQSHRADWETKVAIDNAKGWIAVELHRTADAKSTVVARVVFWDAEGQYSLETIGDELPLVIVEELIAEARQTIKVP